MNAECLLTRFSTWIWSFVCFPSNFRSISKGCLSSGALWFFFASESSGADLHVMYDTWGSEPCYLLKGFLATGPFFWGQSGGGKRLDDFQKKNMDVWVDVKLPDAWESPNVHDSTTFRDHLHRNGVHFVRTPNVGYIELSLYYPIFWGNQTIHIHGTFEGFPV